MTAAKKPLERMRFGRSVYLSEEQHQVMQQITRGHRRSFSGVLESALAAYIPAAFGRPWPPAPRINRPSDRTRVSRTYGFKLTGEQDRLLSELERRVGFSEIAEQALASYVPAAFDGLAWPPLERLSAA